MIYVGAGARLTPDKGLDLDARRWAWMPKIDGCYARVTLNAQGYVSRIESRTGAVLHDAGDLLGIHAGPGDSVMHGELEAHTEAGNRDAAARGWRNLHLFDCTRFAGRDVAGAAFADRFALLHQAQAVIEQTAGREQWWSVDQQGAAHDQLGRYTVPVPRDLRRLPIVPLVRGKGAGAALWSSFVEPGGEGLVAVRLDAPAGARNGKRKIKATDTLDCTVVRADARAAVLAFDGRTFVVSAKGAQLATGAIVEVACDGFYETSQTPRFARIVRERRDLASAYN